MARIGLVTCEQFRSAATEDDLLVAALNARGHDTQRPNWDGRSVQWSDFDVLVIRSTWDYQRRLPEFLQWVGSIEQAGVVLFNPPSVLRWNSHKTYLRELRSKGVALPPTTWFGVNDSWSLTDVMDENGWKRVVVKPMIGAGAFHTFAVTREEAAAHEANTLPELHDRGAIVQEFAPEITRDGEWSLLFFGGRFSHAIIKSPRPGDFRVQEHLGGTYRPAQPSEAVISQATAILKHAPGDLLYARVDGIIRDDKFLLIELEVFEPWFYLTHSEHGTDNFISALEQHLS